MRTRFYIFSLTLISIFLLNSCANNEDYYSLNDIYLSLGLVETENSFGYEYVLFCDNGDTLLPAASDVSYFKATNNQRVLINYTILGDAGTSAKKFYVKINNLQEVLYKDMIELTPENTDSLGHDSVTISNLWIVKDMMNIEFKYVGGIEKHFINLAYTTNEKGQLNQPVELEFRHNANNDPADFLYNGLVTFKLDQLKVAGQDSINVIVKSTGLLEGEQRFSTTYFY